MKLARRAACAAFLLLATVLTAPATRAADNVDPTRAEAAERFDRALRLVNAGDLSGSLAEFQRAYALVPSAVLLYNIGLVHAAMHRPVAAVKALQQVVDHAESLNPDEVVRARRVLQEQTDSIGQVAVTTNMKEGVVEIDNVEAAKLPLSGPLDISNGPHIVGIVSSGYAPARKEVTVAGHQKVDVDLQLVPIQGLLGHIALKSRVPGADVLVDGEHVGKTPLEATITVPPGTHKVQVRRAGYLPAEREVSLTDGSQTDIVLEPTFDKTSLSTEGGYLAIAASEKQPILTVDGDEIGLVTGPVQLPAGPHRLRLESGGFIAAERDVDVPLGQTKTITIIFEPTPETRTAYVSAAESRRTWSWVTIGIGAAITAGGVILGVVEQGQIGPAQNNLNAINATMVRHSGLQCDPAQALSEMTINGVEADVYCNNEETNATNTLNNDQTLRTVGWIGAGVGGAVMITGFVLLLTGDSPHKYDAKPSERTLGGLGVVPWFEPGGGSLAVHGTF
jgi:hypothetical protein